MLLQQFDSLLLLQALPSLPQCSHGSILLCWMGCCHHQSLHFTRHHGAEPGSSQPAAQPAEFLSPFPAWAVGGIFPGWSKPVPQHMLSKRLRWVVCNSPPLWKATIFFQGQGVVGLGERIESSRNNTLNHYCKPKDKPQVSFKMLLVQGREIPGSPRSAPHFTA